MNRRAWRDAIEELAARGGGRPEWIEASGGGDGIESFGEPLGELARLQESVALVPSAAWRRISVSGVDAVDYLHRRLSQSIESLKVGEGAHALALDAEGRLQAELLAYRWKGGVQLLSHRSGAAAALETIEQFILMDEVAIAADFEGEIVMELAGPDAAEIVADLTPGSETAIGAGGYSVQEFAIGGAACLLFRDGRWAMPYYHIAAPLEHAANAASRIAAACRDRGGGLAGERALDALRIEQGITEFGRDTGERTIPLDAALEGAIDFEKGCFPGQEVLARIRNLGHPAKRLARFEGAEEQKIGAGAVVMHEGEEVGRLTSAAPIQGLGRSLGLGYLKWKFRALDEGEIQNAGSSGAVRITPLGREAEDRSEAQRNV